VPQCPIAGDANADIVTHPVTVSHHEHDFGPAAVCAMRERERTLFATKQHKHSNATSNKNDNVAGWQKRLSPSKLATLQITKSTNKTE